MNPQCAFFAPSVLRLAVFCILSFTFVVRAELPTARLTLTNSALVLWLKADAGVSTNDNGLVQQWMDQSGRQNNAVQTNAISMPKLTPSAFNGKPALHFDGVTNYLEIPHSADLAITGDLAVFAVVRVDDFNNLNGIIAKTVTNIPAPFDFYVQQKSGLPYLFRGNGNQPVHLEGRSVVAAGQVAIISAVVRGTKGILYLNGAYNSQGLLQGKIGDGGRPVRIGSRDNFESMLKGDLAEIILFNGTVPDSERTAIHNYLGSKYGINVIHPLSVSEQPTVSRLEGQTATFSVSSDDPTIEYQWQKNEVDIPDATNAVYTTSALTLADSNSHYRARVPALGTNRYVGAITLMVVPDTEPTTVTTAAFLLRDQSHSSSTSDTGTTLPPYNSRLWQTGDEPSRNIIQSIAQTRDGVLWVGTLGGLARFDGEQFEFISVGTTNRLAKRQVNTLGAANDGSLWVGTAGEGLFQLRGEEWVAHSMPRDLDLNILTVRQMRDDSIWIGTRKGIAVFKNEKLSLRDDKNDIAPGPEKDAAAQTVRAIVPDASGDLWVGANDRLMRLHEGAVVSSTNLWQFNTTFIRSICSSRDGGIWMGVNSGLIRFKDGKFTHFTKVNGLPDNIVTVVHEDRRGNLWVGTAAGLCRFADEKFVVELTAEGEVYDQILCLFEDRENNFWVGAKNGLYQLRVQQFTSYTTRHGLAHNNVISVCEDNEGAMWIGTWGGGLHCLRAGKITIYSSAKNKTMHNDLILAIRGARDGGLWFGVDYGGELYRLKEGAMSRYGEEYGFGPTAIRDLLEDSAGRLVIGTAVDSLKILAHGKVTDYEASSELPSKRIRCLLQGHDGRLWVGTEAGLACKVNDHFMVFTVKDGLADNMILSLFEDKEENLWVGTAKGLSRLRRGPKVVSREQKEPFTFYTTAQGFFDEAVLEMLEDDAANLWIATRRGVLRVAKDQFDGFGAVSYSTFGKADGMSSPVCVGVAKPSAWKSKDGRLWFATTKGLAVTDPQLKIDKNEVPPPVVIREVLADKKVQRSKFKVQSRKDSNATASSTLNFEPETLNLSPGRGELEFRYTALSYAAPEKNHFKYKLAGFDADWVDAGTRRSAFYNSVPPGSYEFQVIACNNDGVWNSRGANVKLSLEPHYWQTNWFRVFIALASVGLVASSARSVTRKRMQTKLQQLEQQHAIEKERTRIAQDMHDELGARLTEIRVLSDLTEKKKDQPTEVATQSRRISNASGELIRNLHSIVWAVNPANDSLEKLADYICGFAQPFLKVASIRCRLERP
ncbi:MAG: putative two-component system sensor kinase, partial [Verrucomicrobiales bacterium]|nr:putative two-component system sensor kinase [Verrucomicrobiales bacterium]